MKYKERTQSPAEASENQRLSDDERTILALLKPEYADPEIVRKIHETTKKDLILLMKLTVILGGSFILVTVGHIINKQGISEAELSGLIWMYVVALVTQTLSFSVLHGKNVVHPRYKTLKNLENHAVPADIKPTLSAVRSYMLSDSTTLRLATLRASRPLSKDQNAE